MATIHWMSILLSMSFSTLFAIPEQGKLEFTLHQDKQYAAVAKHMYKNSKVTVSVSLSCEKETDDIEISWMLRLSPCSYEYVTITEHINSNKYKEESDIFFNSPIIYIRLPYNSTELYREDLTHSCSDRQFKLESNPNQQLKIQQMPILPKHLIEDLEEVTAQTKGEKSQAEQDAKSADKSQPSSKTAGQKSASGEASPQQAPSRRKREEPAAVSTTLSSTRLTSPLSTTTVDHETLVKTWLDGNYIFVIRFRSKNMKSNFSADVTIRTVHGDDNYISALDYPLLVFYGVMGLVYILYGIAWLLLLACNWRDLLRVQFWIGGVIFLGMLEKAVFFGEYENLNKTGESGHAVIIFAELVSCSKRTLARMLVIIVSLGFGIVKPRLGQVFNKVLFVGVLFFILSAIEGCMRATSSKVDQSNEFLLAAVPLAVLDAIICWWIFASLLETTRALRLRRNIVKLSLYRHFTNALVFNVLASVAYMVWFLTQHKFQNCIKDWKQLWVDEAFWHVLFIVLLFIIMVLWRPTANNQRYAFSPLLDTADEEDEESLRNDAFDGMKLRGAKNGSPKYRDSSNKMEDDLKWVQDNIPSSLADKALPSMLDSDDELMTTKFEMSKME